MKIVYIASPYADDVRANVKFAVRACRYCIEQGFAPIAPHLMYPQMLDDSVPEQRELGLMLGNQLLSVTDELWICGDKISFGMAEEIKLAWSMGIPIRHIHAEELIQK